MWRGDTHSGLGRRIVHRRVGARQRENTLRASDDPLDVAHSIGA
jgi:hypothetical protein